MHGASGNGTEAFAPRAFEEAPELNGREPAYLVPDGQQRLTSLYQAFTGRGSHRFFLNLQELLDGEDVDEATEVYLAERARQWESIAGQANDLMLPLSRIRRFSEWRTTSWMLVPRRETTSGSCGLS